jgi:cardiolipin synthase
MIGVSFWVIGLIVLGVLILVPLIYLYLRGTFRPKKNYSLIGRAASDPHFLISLASMSDSLITKGSVLEFWSDIDAIQQARLDLISQAERLIQFETFKFGPGKRAEAFAEAICQKARAGVKVQVLVDSYGAQEISQGYWQRLIQAGVELHFFNPFSIRAPLGYVRRNHRKLLLVDQQIAMVGGAGISDLWDGKDDHPGQVPWYDFEVKWQGEVVGLLTGFFWQHWLTTGGHVNLNDHNPGVSYSSADSSVLITPGEEPTTGDSPIRGLFQLTILSAQSRLWISSPYLLPDDATCTMLAQIRARGVDVRILTMGPRSDKAYVYYTSRQRYGKLLNHGIKIHEYQPSMMHGKSVLVDNHWASMGSANLDPRSFFHNDELNLCNNSPATIRQLEEFFVTGFERSHLIDTKTWEKRSLKQKIVGGLGNLCYWQF